MLLMFFLICFVYNVLRGVKDTVVITAPFSGAEALPFIKVWAVLPSAFLMTYIFTRLSNRLSRDNVFYGLMGGFLVFFLLFAFVLYPLKDQIQPHLIADKLQDVLPIGFKGLIAMFRNWTATLFYIMAEMWSTIIMTVLFWGFANDVTSVKDAKRFYALLGISANFSGVISGKVYTSLSQHNFNPHLPFGKDAWGQSVVFINVLLVICGLICIGLYRYLQKNNFTKPVEDSAQANKNQKIKMGIRENFSYLAKSNYLICIAVIVIAYNVCINLVEVVWKDQVKTLYPNPSDFSVCMGQVQMITGILATFTAVFISGNVIRRFGWRFSALIPPMIVLVTSIGFFTFLFFRDTSLSQLVSLFGSTPLQIGVFFGTLQNAFSRASKYTLFDATKELAFVPLNRESKLKGKAAIDGVGSRLGKSGGSIIHQGLLMIFGTVLLSTPYVALILLVGVVSWIGAVNSLGQKFNQLTEGHDHLKITEVGDQVIENHKTKKAKTL